MVQAELKDIIADDLENWETWKPADPTDVYVWYSAYIGPVGEESSNIFQVAVATPKGLKSRKRRSNGRFRGIVIKEWSNEAAIRAIEDYVSAIRGSCWEAVAEQLEKDFRWEYSREPPGTYG